MTVKRVTFQGFITDIKYLSKRGNFYGAGGKDKVIYYDMNPESFLSNFRGSCHFSQPLFHIIVGV